MSLGDKGCHTYFNKGDRFGRLTAKGEHKCECRGTYKIRLEKMVCDCGTEKWISRYSIRRGQIKSCGCLKNENIYRGDFSFKKGDRFGRWTAMGEHRRKHNGHNTYYEEKLICDCGVEKRVKRDIVKKGDSKSCGCYNLYIHSQPKTHGMSNTKFYESWNNMKGRCDRVNTKYYKNYGGRGITYERESFEDFKNDMYESYKQHVSEYGEGNTVLDRLDVDGNYCKNNCRWVARQENAKENCRHLWSYKYGVGRDEISNWCGLSGKILSNKLYELGGDFSKLIRYLTKRFGELPFEIEEKLNTPLLNDEEDYK